MFSILIMDNDAAVRCLVTDVLVESGYDVMVSKTAASGLGGILKRLTQVVLLGSEIDGLCAADLIPILKKCNPHLSIILISEEIPLAKLQKVRRAGIFYHLLKPISEVDKDEIRQVVDCAFHRTRYTGAPDAWNNNIFQ